MRYDSNGCDSIRIDSIHTSEYLEYFAFAIALTVAVLSLSISFGWREDIFRIWSSINSKTKTRNTFHSTNCRCLNDRSFDWPVSQTVIYKNSNIDIAVFCYALKARCTLFNNYDLKAAYRWRRQQQRRQQLLLY